MGCKVFEGGVICGNFAERQESKPKDLDYMQSAKWYEDYPFDWRETLGSTICNCKRVKVNYAPYYGYDYFHMDTCNLMQKLNAEPQIQNLYETYLPAINHYTDAVPNSDQIPLYIQNKSRKQKIKVNIARKMDIRQGVLL